VYERGKLMETRAFVRVPNFPFPAFWDKAWDWPNISHFSLFSDLVFMAELTLDFIYNRIIDSHVSLTFKIDL